MVTLTATASNGWSFLGWQGDASGTNNPLSLTVNQTNNIQAIFGTVVGTNAVGGGSIVLSQPNPIPFGTMLTASAVPDAGNYFVTWSGAASGTNTPTTITVTSTNPTINALFSTLPGGKYSLAVVVMGNGSVAISPQQNYYNPGDSVTLSASTTNAGTQILRLDRRRLGDKQPAGGGGKQQHNCPGKLWRVADSKCLTPESDRPCGQQRGSERECRRASAAELSMAEQLGASRRGDQRNLRNYQTHKRQTQEITR